MKEPPFRNARTYSYSIWPRATCAVCEWTADTKNAQALGARHFDFTGHETRVEVEYAITYKSKDRRKL